jgi:hypothetical protein
MMWQINFCLLDPLIHEDDAKAAIRAHLDESRERRGPRISDETIVQDLFIASVVTNWPPNQQQKEKLIELLSDKKFAERLARAIATGKPPIWDKIDFFFLRNWRELRFNPELKAKIEAQEKVNLPGLNDCSPAAAQDLFRLAKIEVDCADGDFEHWYRTRRARLGLRGNPPYKIKKFTNMAGDIQIVQ